jgi:hypothetical protein
MSRVSFNSLSLSPSNSSDDLPVISQTSSVLNGGSGLMTSGSSARSSSSTSSLMELGWTEDEHFTIERLQRTRKQLEEEIQLMVSELTGIGQETNLTAECEQIIQDQ